MSEAYVFDAVRTPRGKGRPAAEEKAGGALCDITPHELVSQLIAALAVRNGNDAMGKIRRLLLGCVGQVGAQGGHIALVSRLASSLKDDVAVKTLNNYCVSGLTAAGEAVLWARGGDSGLSLAGGVECLSQVPFLADRAAYYSDPALIGALRWAPPVMGAELIASLHGYDKPSLDSLTLDSHQKAAAAWAEGRYGSSVVPVVNADGETALSQDELIRPDLTLAQLADRQPAFGKQGAAGFDAMMLNEHPELAAIRHVHSIANCPGMADGAALVLMGSKDAGSAAGLSARARVAAYVEAAGDPVVQFTAGFDAMDQALQQAGLALHDLDLIEFMEAFAAVPMHFLTTRPVNADRVNVNGGHLAMGHPMGATGCILITSLIHEMERRDVETGLVVAHAGGGIGAAMVLVRD